MIAVRAQRSERSSEALRSGADSPNRRAPHDVKRERSRVWPTPAQQPWTVPYRRDQTNWSRRAVTNRLVQRCSDTPGSWSFHDRTLKRRIISPVISRYRVPYPRDGSIWVPSSHSFQLVITTQLGSD
jgi:hypothetical protein